jgi:hypothetical protein
MSHMIDALVASVTASVWHAAAEVTDHVDDNTLSNEAASNRLRKAVQLRLALTHADLFTVNVTRPTSKKRLRAALEASAKTTPERVWKPTRPALAIEIAKLLQQAVGLVHVPAEKADQCKLPLKVFAKQVAASLTESIHASDYSEKSLVYAVNEVCAAVVNEAENDTVAEGASRGVVMLHACTDAAWRGHTARGSGIAMDEEGKKRFLKAAERVMERLLQPLKLSKLQRYG